MSKEHMMTPQVNLGALLRKIREAKQAAALNEEQDRARAAYEQSQRERNSIRDFWLEYVNHVVNHIMQGKEPKSSKVPDVFIQDGPHRDYLITHELHTHHDVWLEIQAGAAKLGLVVCLAHVDTHHYEMSVEPIN